MSRNPLCPLRNVVFDVGNVLVRWSPAEIIDLTFAHPSQSEVWLHNIFKNDTWQLLNLGSITEAEAQTRYQSLYGLTPSQTARLFYYIKATQIPIYQSHELLERMAQTDLRVFGLTNNIKEIVTHLRQQYDFWQWFEAVVVSAEIGMMKPHPEIFQYILQHHRLHADETVFIDDLLPTIAAASSLGMHTIHFVDAEDTARQLQLLGVKIQVHHSSQSGL